MSLSPTDIIKNAAKHAENEGRTGYDAVSDTWYSHPSPEGGLATIGFGHKGASSDEVASWGIGGMTDEQVSASFDSDWDEATQIAANQYNAAYEDSFSDLPEIGQALLSEIAFNVGRVTNKKGKFGWPSLVRAIKEDDVASMKKEINRTYTDSDGVAHPMDRRVGFLRDAIDEASDEGAPAPSGEDVGSIEALPDSYSHKIGDFFAGLMGGDQPTRNRRTQMVSDVLDWTPVAGVDSMNKGEWELEQGNIGDGVLDTFMGGLEFIPGAAAVTKPAKAAAKVVSKGANKAKGLMSDLADEVGDMLFIHGTDADKLKLYDAIGGQPMPSLAVTQKDIPFDWGDIDLIGKKGSFSPESNSLNDLYSTDAYTVRSNMPLRKAKEDAGDLFRKRFGNVGHYASELDNSDLASVEIDDYFNGRFGMGPTLFAKEKGIPITKMPDGFIDIKTKHFIRDNHGPEYRVWTQEQMDYLFEPELYRMKLGKMVPYDVEDVTEEMVKKRGIGTEGFIGTTGYDKATGATKFKSLAEAKAARSALMEKSIADTKYNEMDYEGVAPTQYFESKPARSVGFKEYAGAIVPEHVDDKTLKILKDRGLHIEKYATPDERLAARGKFKSEMFTLPATAAATGLLGAGAVTQSEKPQEFNTGGMVGMMTPTLEVIVGHDEESGNPIPAGSTDKEVRDDVEALLSEGEYVLPADVVRWHGLKHIQEMRDEAKCGLMCMSMDGQIKTPESDEAYEEPSDDEDVEVTEEGNEIEIVDNTDEKKIKAADGGLIGSTYGNILANTSDLLLDDPEEGDTEEPASLGYLVRRLVRGPSGRMEVRYFDPETGMYVDDPTGYEVLDQNAYNSLNGAGMRVSGDDSGDDTAAEEVIDEAGSTSGDREDRYTLPEEPNTQVERNMATDYGFEDPNKLVTMGAGLLGGPLIGGAVRFGQSYNNAEAVDAAREDLGMEGLSWWDKVKGGFSGKYNNGAIGRDAIGENDYTAGFGGRVYEDEHGNKVTTLTPNEWKKRTEAQDIDISTLPSAFDSEGTQTHTPPASSEQSDPWEGYGEAMQAKNDYLLGLAQEDGEKTTERSGFMSHFENPTAHKMFGKSYSDLTDDEKMATALRSQIDMGTANMAQGRQYEEIMARIDATNSASRTSSTSTGDSGGGIMTSQVTPHVSDTTPEIAPMPTWEDEVEMDTDFSWWDDTDTDDVVVSTAPHAEISGGNSINPVDPANEYYADLYGEEGRSTPGFLSPIDEIYLQEEMFLRDVRENDLPPAPSNDSDNSSSSSSNSSSSKDRDNNSSSSSSSGGGWTQPTKPAEEDDTPSYTYDSSGRVGYGYGL